MADRYFKVEKDTSLPRAYRAVRDNSGTVYDYEVEGIAYSAGDYVPEENVDPRVVERFDDGDEHLNSLLSVATKEEAEENAAALKAAGQLVRVPEHTVEAHKLASDPDEPYVLLSEAEGIELQNERVEELKEAQEKGKEESGDDLPDQEFNAIDFSVAKGELDKDAGNDPVTPSDVVNSEEVSSEPAEPKKGKAKKAAEEGKLSPSNATEADSAKAAQDKK
jgi:hypothetical protein